MKRLYAALFVLTGLIYYVAAVAQSVNPPIGSVYTFLGPTLGADWRPVQTTAQRLVSAYGGDITGSQDASTALSSCINDTGPNSRCTVDLNAFLNIDHDITISANRTLDCQQFNNNVGTSSPTLYAGLAAIRLNSSAKIIITGGGVTIQNCLIYRKGMTFGATSPVAYAGTAIKFGASAWGATIKNTTIIGFQFCIDNTGGSGGNLVEDILCDANPIVPTQGAIATGLNGDTNVWHGIKILPVGTGNGLAAGGNCLAELRNGVGFSSTGQADFMNFFSVQDFTVSQYLFTNANVIKGGQIVADFDVVCLRGLSIGFHINGGSDYALTDLDINSTHQGLVVEGNTPQANISFGDIQFNQVEQDCLVAGSPVSGGGQIYIAYLRTNGASLTNCGRYGIHYADTSGTTALTISAATLQKINGNSAPYICTDSGSQGNQLRIDHLTTDLSGDVNPYGCTQMSPATIPSAAKLIIPVNVNAPTWIVDGTVSITSLGGVYGGLEFTLIYNNTLTVSAGNNIRLAAGVSNRVTQSGTVQRFLCYYGGTVICQELEFVYGSSPGTPSGFSSVNVQNTMVYGFNQFLPILPPSPPSNGWEVYTDVVDGKLKAKNPLGKIITLAQ